MVGVREVGYGVSYGLQKIFPGLEYQVRLSITMHNNKRLCEIGQLSYTLFLSLSVMLP